MSGRQRFADFKPHDFGDEGTREVFRAAGRGIWLDAVMFGLRAPEASSSEFEALAEAQGRWARGRAALRRSFRGGEMGSGDFQERLDVFYVHWPMRVEYGVTTCAGCGSHTPWPCPVLSEVEEELGCSP